MDLERAIGVLRPRAPWEAVDFGWLIGRRLYGPMLRAWLVVAVPLALAILATNWNRPWLAVVILWLLRPLLETPLLFVLSRGLFSQPCDLRTLLPQLHRVVGADLAPRLLWRRFDPQRSYTLPVSSLEGLRGKRRRQRARLLAQRQGSQASEFTYVCLGLEFVVILGLTGLVFLMLPEALHPDWPVFFDQDLWYVPLWGRLAFGMAFIAMTVVEPLYVSGGFGLYLNRRTVLEGWDIQLAFQRLAARAKQATAVLVLLFGLCGMPVVSVQAQEPAEGVPSAEELEEFFELTDEEPSDAIDPVDLTPIVDILPLDEGDIAAELETILDDKEFGWEETVTRWETRKPAEEAGTEFGFLGGLLGQLLEILLWVVALAALGALGYWLVRSSQAITLPQREPKRELPTQLMGMDVRPESLPDNVPVAARALLGRGDHIGALSLLYRGALARLIHGFELELEDGATENDCIRAVRAVQGPAHWFEGLTQAWQSEAYARRPLAEADIDGIIDGWTAAIENSTPAVGATR
ncbi:MAG: hypothetical protein KDA24_01095 [Deltaproteobacteria bacterium]|nr:hypothetical protein [Deltaproteobacteria bacterium]